MRVLAVPRSTPIAFAGKSDPALKKGQRIQSKSCARPVVSRRQTAVNLRSQPCHYKVLAYRNLRYLGLPGNWRRSRIFAGLREPSRRWRNPTLTPAPIDDLA